MTDIFLREDLKSLLANKKVVFLGDSNVRSSYKDFLCLYHESKLIPDSILRAKMEESVYGDRLINHKEKTNGRDYTEERIFLSNDCNISFYFLTRVYNERVERILSEIIENKEPDVIILNSCVWDISRWGPNGIPEYKKNLKILMKRFNDLLSTNCLVIWMSAPPISQEPRGGFVLVELDFFKYSMRFNVMEANHYARKVVVKHGYDVLDIHYHLRMQLQRRTPDGIHWTPEAKRYVTNLLLTHIALSWGEPLPHRYNSDVTTRALQESENAKDDSIFKIEDTPVKPPIKITKDSKANVETSKTPKSKRKINSHQAFIKNARKRRHRERAREWLHSPQQRHRGSQQQNFNFHSQQQNFNFHSHQQNFNFHSCPLYNWEDIPYPEVFTFSAPYHPSINYDHPYWNI